MRHGVHHQRAEHPGARGQVHHPQQEVLHGARAARRLRTSLTFRAPQYDFTLAEYSTLCGVSYSSSGPWLQAYSWNASAPSVCLAHPANLKDMSAQVIAAGRNVIPEQKNCDLLCQAKVAAFGARAPPSFRALPVSHAAAVRSRSQRRTTSRPTRLWPRFRIRWWPRSRRPRAGTRAAAVRSPARHLFSRAQFLGC